MMSIEIKKSRAALLIAAAANTAVEDRLKRQDLRYATGESRSKRWGTLYPTEESGQQRWSMVHPTGESRQQGWGMLYPAGEGRLKRWGNGRLPGPDDRRPPARLRLPRHGVFAGLLRGRTNSRRHRGALKIARATSSRESRPGTWDRVATYCERFTVHSRSNGPCTHTSHRA